MKKIITFTMALLILAINTFAQENIKSALQDTVNLDEVVVTGTPVRVNRMNIPMAVSVINNLRISESAESSVLTILNGRVPGLFVTERGIMGFGVASNAAGQISIRGIGGSPTTGVLMLIDGHPQFMGLFGHPLSDSYLASDVDRVEVIRGPGSLLYGSNAMGGVINIITKKQTNEGFNANASLMYGSFNTQKEMVSLGYQKKKISLFGSINHDQTDGHRANSDFSMTNGYLKFSYELNNNIQVTSDFNLTRFQATDPGPDTVNALPGSSLDIKRGYWALTIDNNFENKSGTVKLFYNFGEHKISDGFHSTDVNYGFNIFEAFKLYKGNSITLGADYLNYGGIAENELAMGGTGIIFKDTTVYDAGIYGFVQQTLFQKLTLNAGLRLQDHQVYGKEWIPAGGVAYKMSQASTLKVSVAKGFRSPTIQELYIFNHNENLKPESVMSYETGFMQSFSDNKIRLELTAYIIKGNNLIINVPLQGLQNAGEVLNKGLEFSFEIRTIKNLDLNLTYSYVDMKSPVYATPKQHLFVGGNYHINKLRFMTSLQYINDLDTDPTTSTSFQTYTLWNSKISYALIPSAELFLSAENMLNQKYENNRYYTMPGATFFAGLKLKLQ